MQSSSKSQSASAAVCLKTYCRRTEPKTSETDSLSAPDWNWYAHFAIALISLSPENHHQDKLTGVLRHAVKQLMRNHVDALHEIVEEHAIPVAKHHLPPVPERVAEPVPVVHGRDQRHAPAVDGVALEDLGEEVVHDAQVLVHVVDGLFVRAGPACRRRARIHELARQVRVVFLVLHIKDAAFGLERRAGHGRLAVWLPGSKFLVVQGCGGGVVPGILAHGVGVGDPVCQVWGHDARVLRVVRGFVAAVEGGGCVVYVADGGVEVVLGCGAFRGVDGLRGSEGFEDEGGHEGAVDVVVFR